MAEDLSADPAGAARQKAALRGVGSYGRHIFICTGPDCCTPEEGEAAWARLKKRTAELNASGTGGTVYRTKVGCLRICEQGPIGLVYPDGTWYACLNPENVDRVIDEHLAAGAPVKDLIIGNNPLSAP